MNFIKFMIYVFDIFLLKEYLKRFSRNKKRIGFVVPYSSSYNKVMASTRIRCYDIIKFLGEKNIFAELYKKKKKYRVVVFQKAFLENHIKLAKKLKERDCAIIFDININVLDKTDHAFNHFSQELIANLKTMLNLADTVIVSSEFLLDLYKKYNPNILLIEESVPDIFFKKHKIHMSKKPVKLVYVGYAAKANELLLISNVLKRLYRELGIKLFLVCDKDPKLDIIPYEFVKYNQKKIHDILLKGDIKIAPRDLTNRYNLGHTFTKIAYPLAVGLPVVASEIPSYKDRIAILCKDEDCWYRQLKELIKSPERRTELGNLGRVFVKKNFCIEKIGKEYTDLFNRYLEV